MDDDEYEEYRRLRAKESHETREFLLGGVKDGDLNHRMMVEDVVRAQMNEKAARDT